METIVIVPMTPVRENKERVVPDAPKKPKTQSRTQPPKQEQDQNQMFDHIDEAIARGHVIVRRGGGYWSNSFSISDPEGDD
jgi:hypothetical protein